jgi:hypothetical protein
MGGLDSMIASLYDGGMTVRDIEHHSVTTMRTELRQQPKSPSWTITAPMLSVTAIGRVAWSFLR